jgi:hypothetical protein
MFNPKNTPMTGGREEVEGESSKNERIKVISICLRALGVDMERGGGGGNYNNFFEMCLLHDPYEGSKSLLVSSGGFVYGPLIWYRM